MDKSPLAHLTDGLTKLGVTLPEGGAQRLLDYAAELLKWNEKVNLTAITALDEVIEKHLLDSLAVLPEVTGARALLDLGAGAGLPGIPLAVALPALEATLVDAVEKKVAFMKTGAVKAQVVPRVKARHVRAGGRPDAEGLPRVDLVISRAFMDVGPFLALAKPYLVGGGRVVAMLGQAPPEEALGRVATGAGFLLDRLRTFTLPFSGDPRGVAVFRLA